MKVILAEGSVHLLATLEMVSTPREGDEIVIHNKVWTVDKPPTHLPKGNEQPDLNDNIDCVPWDEGRDADLYVHVTDDK